MNRHAEKKRNILREALGILACLVCLCVLIFLAINFFGEQMEISDDSMYPALNDGDRVMVEKISYTVSEPKRFDVIVFPIPYQDDTYYIRRVIGLPGETVQISGGEIYINRVKLEDPYGFEDIKNSGLAEEEVTLGEQEYFVLGDNRNNSIDSREPSIGNISRDQIEGEAVFCIWPIRSFGFIH